MKFVRWYRDGILELAQRYHNDVWAPYRWEQLPGWEKTFEGSLAAFQRTVADMLVSMFTVHSV